MYVSRVVLKKERSTDERAFIALASIPKGIPEITRCADEGFSAVGEVYDSEKEMVASIVDESESTIGD